MEVQTYYKRPVPTIVDKVQQNEEEVEARLKDLSKGTTAAIFYEEIGAKDHNVWKAFLPTTYLASSGGWTKVRMWQPGNRYESFPESSRLNFDESNIPATALKGIDRARTLHFFDRLELWTPEYFRVNRDPMVVGWTDDRYFKIVRWGEALEDFRTIKRRTFARRHSLEMRVAGFLLSIVAFVSYLIIYGS